MGKLSLTGAPGVVTGAARVTTPGAVVTVEPVQARSQGMDGVRELLDAARASGLVADHLRGLLHIAIGRSVTRPDGTVLSTGLTWRELAAVLKQLRFDRELVRELGANPEQLAPRDRQRFWYSAIALAKVDAPEALAQAEELVSRLKELGFIVAPAAPGLMPATRPVATTSKAKSATPKPKPKIDKPAKRKKI